MRCREDILTEVEKELDDLLTAAPDNLSETDLKSIKEESIGYAQHVLNALSSRELQSPLALERFIETTRAQARLSTHMRGS